MFKCVILGIIFIVVFLTGYLTIWKYILKPLTKEGDFPPKPVNTEPKPEPTKEGESVK